MYNEDIKLQFPEYASLLLFLFTPVPQWSHSMKQCAQSYSAIFIHEGFNLQVGNGRSIQMNVDWGQRVITGCLRKQFSHKFVFLRTLVQ